MGCAFALHGAPKITHLVVLPLTFISSVWFPPTGMPAGLVHIAKLFPVRPLADGLEYAFNPHTVGAGFNGPDLRSLLIWTPSPRRSLPSRPGTRTP